MELCTSLNQGHMLGGITEAMLSIFQQCLVYLLLTPEELKKT